MMRMKLQKPFSDPYITGIMNCTQKRITNNDKNPITREHSKQK
jgi:hypothetical protein